MYKIRFLCVTWSSIVDLKKKRSFFFFHTDQTGEAWRLEWCFRSLFCTVKAELSPWTTWVSEMNFGWNLPQSNLDYLTFHFTVNCSTTVQQLLPYRHECLEDKRARHLHVCVYVCYLRLKVVLWQQNFCILLQKCWSCEHLGHVQWGLLVCISLLQPGKQEYEIGIGQFYTFLIIVSIVEIIVKLWIALGVYSFKKIMCTISLLMKNIKQYMSEFFSNYAFGLLPLIFHNGCKKK